ncbi:MAG: phospholipid carrier-dependent glycosyltransferase [bacterium]|nr:phospholipid carrier-dependent glycosyltransferase [bacterium]
MRTPAISRHWIVAAVLIVVFAVQCAITAGRSSLANDEGKHLVTGWWLARNGECCLGVDNSPLTAVYMLPLVATTLRPAAPIEPGDNAHTAGRDLLFGSPDPSAVLFRARLATIAAGLLMLLAAAELARRYHGPAAAWLTLGLLAFDPNVIAHVSLISTDALFACLAVLFLLALDDWSRKPGPWRAAVVGLALGVALASKWSALILLPAVPPVVWLYRKRLGSRAAAAWLRDAGVAVAVAVVVTWLSYGGHLSGRLPFFEAPGMKDGFLQARAYATGGMVAFFNGEVGRDWRLYFLEAVLLKTPIPLLLGWLAAAAAWFVTRGRDAERLAPVVLAAAFFGTAVSSKLNIGLRHVLPLFPLLAIFCGGLAPALGCLAGRARRLALPVAAAAFLWLAFEALSIAPFQLSYFNQFAGGPEGGRRYLGDSNLDWGQDLGELERVMRRRGIDEVILSYVGNTDPSYYGIRYQFLPPMFVGSPQGARVVDAEREVIAISTNNLQGFLSRRIDYGWLAEREPIDRAGYSIYLYDITGDTVAHRRLAEIYAAAGFHGLAAKERRKAAIGAP